MNLQSLHTYLGQLLDAGVAPDIPVVALADEWPREVHDIYMFDGGYHADMAPKLVVGRLIQRRVKPRPSERGRKARPQSAAISCERPG